MGGRFLGLAQWFHASIKVGLGGGGVEFHAVSVTSEPLVENAKPNLGKLIERIPWCLNVP